jgi:translation initiation factor IF-2
VIEARLDRTRGPVATFLVQQGTLRKGDPFVVGLHYGKVRALFDDLGREIKEAGPSTPVEILGLSGVPEAGDTFQVVTSEKRAKEISLRRQEIKREAQPTPTRITLDRLSKEIKEGKIKELNVIIKADVQGSVEVLRDSLEKLSTEEVRVKVIHGGVGGINESDVMLAAASNAIIIGFHVRPDGRVREVAAREGVDIRPYQIIYEVTDDVRRAMEGLLSPKIEEEIIGVAEVRKTFRISKVGTVAGCYVKEGKVRDGENVRVIRDGVVVFEGKIKSLKRFKDSVQEVASGLECGIAIENFNDIKIDDLIEVFRITETPKTL